MRLASLTFIVFTTYPPHITGPQVLTTVLGSSGLAGPRTHVRKGADTPRMFYIIVLMNRDDMPSSHHISASVEPDGDPFGSHIPKLVGDNAGESESSAEESGSV
jgi:hypothetical protein